MNPSSQPENQLDNDKEELRQSILVEFRQVHKLAPADYTRNCTNVVMSLIDQYTQSKLEAFAGDFEALLKNQPMPKRGDVDPDIYVEVLHRIEGANATRGEIREALKAIKGKAGIE